MKGFHRLICVLLFAARCSSLSAQEHSSHLFDYDKAIGELKTSLSRLPSDAHDTTAFNSLYELANLYWIRYQNNKNSIRYHDSANYYNRQLIRIGVLAGNLQYQSSGYMMLGLGQMNRGNDYKTILTYLLTAINLAEQYTRGHKKPNEYIEDVQNRCYSNIGFTYLLQGDYLKALAYCDLALKYAKADYVKVMPMLYKARVYMKLGQLNDASKTLRAAIGIGDNFKILNRIEGRDYLAELYLLQGKLDSAVQLLHYALVLDKKGHWYSLTYYRLGQAFLQQKNADSALKYAKLENSIIWHNPDGLANEWAKELLYKANELKGNFKEALVSYKAWIRGQDSLNTIIRGRDIVEIQHKYEYEKLQAAAGKQKLIEERRIFTLQESNTDQKLKAQEREEQEAKRDLQVKIHNQTLHALALKDKNFQQARINALTISDLDKKVQLQRRNRYLLLTGLASLCLISSLLVLYSVKMWNNNRNLSQKNKEIEEALFKGQHFERKRVASELHDNLSSLLAATKLTMAVLNPSSLPLSEQKIFQNVQEMIANACKEVRYISHNLMPPEIEQLGLQGVMDKLLDKLNQTGIIKFSLGNLDPRIKLSTVMAFNIYAICLECCNNILRHSKASQAAIIFKLHENELNVFITDNGIGIHTEAGEGIGLSNVQERVNSLGGSLEVQSSREGTSFWFTFPLQEHKVQVIH